jgi:hypothetical protein
MQWFTMSVCAVKRASSCTVLKKPPMAYSRCHVWQLQHINAQISSHPLQHILATDIDCTLAYDGRKAAHIYVELTDKRCVVVVLEYCRQQLLCERFRLQDNKRISSRCPCNQVCIPRVFQETPCLHVNHRAQILVCNWYELA